MRRSEPPHPFDALDQLENVGGGQRADLAAAERALALREFDKTVTRAMAKRTAATETEAIAATRKVSIQTAAAIKERALYWVNRLTEPRKNDGN